jgi:N utilization substance protein B
VSPVSSQPPRPSKRRQVRERVLQALYAFELSGDDAEHVLKHVVAPAFEGERAYGDFARKLFLRAADARTEADVLIERHVQNWEISRLALTDRLVLWIAIAEFLYFEDIPPKVTLNEAVEVARAFGSDNSAGFVNGVLDAVLGDLRAAGRLHKTGRGLVDAGPRAVPASEAPAGPDLPASGES